MFSRSMWAVPPCVMALFAWNSACWLRASIRGAFSWGTRGTTSGMCFLCVHRCFHAL